MVQQWRVMIDAYNKEKGGDTRVLFTEAYASIEDTVRYYADEEGQPRAHFPFNFVLIEKLNEGSSAASFSTEIEAWVKAAGNNTSNWVVSGCVGCRTVLKLLDFEARESRQAKIWISLWNGKNRWIVDTFADTSWRRCNVQW